jgi:S1-C subfamily serine protease
MFVPAELLPPILDDLARGKPAHPPRPWLGVFAQETETTSSSSASRPRQPRRPRRTARRRPDPGRRRHAGLDLAEFYESMWSLGDAGVSVPLKIRREGDVFEVEVRSMDRASLLKKRRLN